MKLASLQDLFIMELKDIYSAETQIIKALPKMAKATTTPELRQAFEEHLEQTRTHVTRIEQIFERMGGNPKGKRCKGMEGLLEEGEELMGEKADPAIMDAGLIAAAQKVEHYEISGYGTAHTYARMLGNPDAARLLEQTLNEEKQADQRLTRIAENMVNQQAKQVGNM